MGSQHALIEANHLLHKFCDSYLALRLPSGCESGEVCFDRSVATCVLALIDEETHAPPTQPRPLLNRRRCRIEASGTLILAHQQSIQYWQQALEAASGPAHLRVVSIANQRRMRSLTVAEALLCTSVMSCFPPADFKPNELKPQFAGS